ncbi:hypothetical protein CesoFtcFv8_021669 [Champsocephalus esox]|uniref:Uncharacterized protein n=1 Tax=Champsocephalus esox TaxID=159716 RepID=A0AAN8B8Y5_9TELE|nr:hypothetical protein CesoFtcFv8_021669 [Champsocephalus esox]
MSRGCLIVAAPESDPHPSEEASSLATPALGSAEQGEVDQVPGGSPDREEVTAGSGGTGVICQREEDRSES